MMKMFSSNDQLTERLSAAAFTTHAHGEQNAVAMETKLQWRSTEALSTKDLRLELADSSALE